MHNAIRECLNGFWLTGPIFDKELRVSSRRRRNYLIRVGYITLLAIFLSIVWVNTVGSGSRDTYSVSRMASAGQDMVILVVWFQFITCQLLAIVMLSTAISGEVYHRTLGVLMTTPINSLQIVFGKLFSKLLQLILLLAISLPLLAIIRVFGGVPWKFVVQALIMTLSATVFVGALSLFYSIYLRRNYVVIIVALITVAVLYLFIPLFTILVGQRTISPRTFEQFFSYVSPLFALGTLQQYAFFPGSVPWQGGHHWLGHCGIMLAASAALLAWSVARVRLAALKQIAGGAAAAPPSKKTSTASAAEPALSGPIESIRGCPIRWKEFRTPLLGRYRWLVLGMSLLLLIPLVILYAYVGAEGDLDEDYVHMVFVAVYMGLGMLLTIVIPATGITSEKESQSWPVLLGTTIGDGAILMGKFWGALRRCLWAWVPLLAHVLIFTLWPGIIHPIAAVGILLVVSGAVIFHIGSGLYFSTLSKRTTTAVVLNFILPALIWLLIPMLMFLAAELAHTSDNFAEAYIDGIPLFQSIALMEGGVPASKAMRYRGPYIKLNGIEVLLYLVVTASMYGAIGCLFAWRAKCRFRKNIFR